MTPTARPTPLSSPAVGLAAFALTYWAACGDGYVVSYEALSLGRADFAVVVCGLFGWIPAGLLGLAATSIAWFFAREREFGDQRFVNPGPVTTSLTERARISLRFLFVAMVFVALVYAAVRTYGFFAPARWGFVAAWIVGLGSLAAANRRCVAFAFATLVVLSIAAVVYYQSPLFAEIHAARREELRRSYEQQRVPS